MYQNKTKYSKWWERFRTKCNKKCQKTDWKEASSKYVQRIPIQNCMQKKFGEKFASSLAKKMWTLCQKQLEEVHLTAACLP